MGEKKVVILVDNKKRDLPGDALIALHLKKMGVKCFLEPLEAYRGCLAADRPDMIVFNHMMGSHLVAFSKRLSKLGVMVAVLPNEGILYNPDVLKFNAGKYHTGAHIDYFFCWNQLHRDALLHTGFDSDLKAEVVGPPKFDFYFEPWSRIFNITGKPGGKPRVLVCTDFVLAKYKELPRELCDKLFAPWKDRIPAYRDYWAAIEVNHNSRRRFFGFLDEIVSSSKFSVTLRPHPGEDARPYKQWYEALDPTLKKDVILDTDSGITELILSCDIEISCETCTTALESWIVGKPTIELVFDRHPLFFHEDVAALNVLCDKPGEIVPLILDKLENPVPEDFKDARRRHLEKWCSSPDGSASYRVAKIIAGALEDRKEVDWTRLTLDERRRGAKLKLLRGLDLPYNYDPLLFARRLLFKDRYAGKVSAYRKAVRPSDAEAAVSALEGKCGGA